MQANNRKQTKRVLISLSMDLLSATDRQAKADYTSRSELMRRALMEYLRPHADQASEQDLFTDPDEVLQVLQRRKLRISLQEMQKVRKRNYASSKSISPTLKY